MTAPYQSKLIPHEDFIRQCRAKRWSYPRIAAALLKQHGLKAGSATIFDFVKVRAKKRRAFELPAREEPSLHPADDFFEPPTQPKKPHEIRKPKWNLDNL
jgi:putative SOS response-associated peptidase YedK